MARPRFFRADPQRQQAVLKAAAREFARAGYEGASLNQIIEAAGLSKGVFYYYFDDKADLAATVVETTVRSYLRALGGPEVLEADEDFWAIVERYAHDSLATVSNSPEQTDLLTRLGSAMVRDSELAKRLEPFIREAMDIIGQLWRLGQERGAVRDDLPVEVLGPLLVAVKQALIRALLPADRPPSTEELHHFLDVQLDLFHRIASKDAPAYPKRARPAAKPAAARAHAKAHAPSSTPRSGARRKETRS